MSNPFLDILSNPPAAAPPENPAISILEQFCDGIKGYRPSTLGCSLILGRHPTKDRRSYRAVLKSLRTGYEYTLLRADVPIGEAAAKCQIDFYDFQKKDFRNEKQLKDGLKEFLARPTTRAVIDEYAR